MHQNAHRVRKQAKKSLPSGGRPDRFYSNPEEYNGEECLIKVDIDMVEQLLQESEDGKEKMWFTDHNFDPLAKVAYEKIGAFPVTLENVWRVFSLMINQLEG